MRLCLLIASICLYCNVSFPQSGDSSIQSSQNKLLQTYTNISSKSLNFINDKYAKLTATIQKQNEKLLNRMQQKEARLQRKLQSIDSTKSAELFAETKAKYEALQQQSQSPVTGTISKLKEYIPGLDSTNTILNFLNRSSINIPGIPADKLQQIQAVSTQVQALQARLQQANDIQTFIRERESTFREQLLNTGLGKELVGINKEVFYFQQRLAEYKNLLNDKKALEEKLLQTVMSLPAFQSFWQKHSFLSQLFPMPQNYGTSQSLNGLQTIGSVQTQLQQRLGSSAFSSTSNGANVGGNYFQQQMQAAQSQINNLKDKITQLGGGSSDMTVPDFKPNNQHTKTFFQRLEYGLNVQSQPGSYLLPTTSDIALTVGYKFSDKATAGFGLAYKLGWGNGWNHIAFSSQGIGLRSYIDIKALGNIWVTGGFEYSYLQAFSNYTALKNLDAWQKSALLGITKKYKVGKKTGNVQLLYDFLHNNQVPPSQGLKFRAGWTF